MQPNPRRPAQKAQGSRSFLKKRTKKLLFAGVRPTARAPANHRHFQPFVGCHAAFGIAPAKPIKTASETKMVRDRVLLLHGIAAGSRSLRQLELAIESSGYETLNLSYPSCRMSLSDLVEEVHAKHEWIAQHGGQTHFVTYSMGGLLARGYITRHRPSNLGRVVMLAPPNCGSEIADLLARNVLYRFVFGPVGRELTTHPTPTFSQLLGKVDYSLGVIAGNRFIDPFGWLLIPGPNDGRVSVERTKVEGMTDHITLSASHFAMMRNRSAIRQAIHFLQNGCFS